MAATERSGCTGAEPNMSEPGRMPPPPAPEGNANPGASMVQGASVDCELFMAIEFQFALDRNDRIRDLIIDDMISLFEIY